MQGRSCASHGNPISSRGKKVKTDTAAPTAAAPVSKAKKVGSFGDGEAAKEQQEAGGVGALANWACDPLQRGRKCSLDFR